MYEFRKNVSKLNFSDQFSKFVICYQRKAYNIGVMIHSACLAIVLITVDLFAYLINFMRLESVMAPT